MIKTFAKVENDIVAEVVSIDRATHEECLSFLMKYSNNYSNWVEVDPNNVQSGFAWDKNRNKFIPPKIYQSWVFNDEKNMWEAPVQYPQDGKMYFWDENLIAWVLYQRGEV